MKKKGKHSARQPGLPGIRQPEMGRPKTGRVLKSYFISEHYAIVLEEMAKLAGVTPARYLEQMVEETQVIHVW